MFYNLNNINNLIKIYKPLLLFEKNQKKSKNQNYKKTPKIKPYEITVSTESTLTSLPCDLRIFLTAEYSTTSEPFISDLYFS